MLHVRILSMPGCEAGPRTVDIVKKTADDLNIPIRLEKITITTAEEAKKHRFIGSPTVQVNGVDIDPGARDYPHFGVT